MTTMEFIDKIIGHHPLEKKDARPQVDITKSYLISMAVSLPSLLLLGLFAKMEINWFAPQLWLIAILSLSLVNFVVLICLDEFRNKIGSFTLPFLIGTVGLVLMAIILKAFEEFFYFVSLKWILPFVVLFLLFCPLAIFKEKTLALKIHLSLNSIALAILWSLGDTDKLQLPF